MKSFLDWSSYKDAGMGDAYADIPKTGGDFAKAVSVCINSRQCEISSKGVMCPSFRVTGDTNLSTGGRVRLLKAALDSELGDSSFQNAELAKSMELCVSCKGCKRECENEVDMAMIKVEYLAHLHRQNPPSLRTRMLTSLPQLLHHFPFLRQLIHWRNEFSPLAQLSQYLIGISAKRKLPEPTDKPFFIRRSALDRHGWWEYRRVVGTTPAMRTTEPESSTEKCRPKVQPTPEVVLFIDTFTNNFTPQNAQAAKEVLTRAGYQVILAQPDKNTVDSKRPLCCGRTHIANGMVEQARSEANRVLAALLPHAKAGRKIIGLEPACLLAIRDDYNFLGLGEDAATIAKQCLLFEEFIAREINTKKFTLPMKPIDTGGKPVLIHGHCHQKAVGAMKSMRKVLKAIPELEFKLIESSCCGMAGSFGIEKEHADLSMEMAEQSLLPTIRNNPKSRIIANGFSCIHQIEEATNRSSTHIAVLMQAAIAAK